MRTLFKVGMSLLILAFVLIGLSYSMLKAQGISSPVTSAGRSVESQTREVGADIQEIDLDGPIDLTLRQGASPSLQVKGEARLLGNVDTSDNGEGVLHIGTTGMLLHHRQPLQVVLVLPSLRELRVRGSGDSTVNGFSGDAIAVHMEGTGTVKFNGRYRQVDASVRGSGAVEMNGGTSGKVEVRVEGSGKMTVVGSASELNATVAGSGDINARHLAADVVNLELMGSGSAVVNAQRRLDATVRGSGDVKVFGNPLERSVTVNGSGDITYQR
ncbi:MAG: hypothetical protein JWP59_1452 [Massilia sp.]|nr:hypothetical protein [Massilia sp.]